MSVIKNEKKRNQRRVYRVRNKIRKVANGRMRLSVHGSNNHMYAQIIDDAKGTTIAFASTVDKDVAKGLKHCGNVEAAGKVGKKIAELAKKAKVEEVIFDRGSLRYHGRVKALADAAREAGMKF